jgi:2-methylcitrate dehydratase
MFEEATLQENVLRKISSYVHQPLEENKEALATSRLCLLDSIGCAVHALSFPACTKLLGPVIPGTKVPGGSRVIGTPFVVDPILAAFNNGMLIRWLDFNDTWLAKEWGHPSDNFGSLLALTDYLSQKAARESKQGILIKDLLEAAIKSYEIQGVLAIENCLNAIGFDHVMLVKIASSAVCSYLLGNTQEQTYHTLSQAFIDTGPLRTYRHSPNTGSRKSWAAGDATARGLFLAWMTSLGEKGYQTPLSAKNWGFEDAILSGNPLSLKRPLNSYVMGNILFKVAYPAEFHSQTAVEAAVQLHPQVVNHLDKIKNIYIDTHEAAIRIIDKTGPLHNPADRDHCMQYMVSVALLKGNLTAKDYEEDVAKDPNIDLLRKKIVLREDLQFTEDYFDLDKRAITNQITIEWESGENLPPVKVEYPLGHKFRREESHSFLIEKFHRNMRQHFKQEQIDEIQHIVLEANLEETFVDHLLFKLSKN